MRRRRDKGRNVDGIIVLDKAMGKSSNFSLQDTKKLYEANKAGHTGSLDPLATGVLPLCFGEATKVSQFLLDSDKRYVVQIKLGERTDSGDSAGNLIKKADKLSLSHGDIEEALKIFTGSIQQVPPMYSALKKNGVPLYKLARKGISVDRNPRLVTVYAIEFLNFEGNLIELDITCSKGTYIRAIADDLGLELGCGAHVVALRRTQAGPFTIENSVDLEVLREAKLLGGIDKLDEFLVPMDHAIIELPEVTLPSISAGCVKNGQAVTVKHLLKEGFVRLYEEERFIGIGRIDTDGKVAPRRLVVS